MKNNMVFWVLAATLVVAAVLNGGAEAADILVGGDQAWKVPTSDVNFYSSWAAGQKFTVGDVLVFRFAPGAHDVARVTKSAYDSCDSKNPISLDTASPFNFTLTMAEDYYFFCAVSDHCSRGQKLAITNVKKAGSGGGPPSPSKPPSASPSPNSPPSSGDQIPPPAGAIPSPPTGSMTPPPPGSSASTITSTFTVVSVLVVAVLTSLFNH